MQEIYGDTLDDVKEQLCEKHIIFKKIFQANGETSLLETNEMEQAKEMFENMKSNFNSKFSHMNLCSFIQEWKNELIENQQSNSFLRDNDVDCLTVNKGGVPIFDYQNASYRNNIPIVRPPNGKGRPVEFDPFKFILECNSKNLGIPINLRLETEEDIYEDFEIDSFQEILSMKEYADNDLRYIAKIVAILNERKSRYHILDLCGENHLHVK